MQRRKRRYGHHTANTATEAPVNTRVDESIGYFKTGSTHCSHPCVPLSFLLIVCVCVFQVAIKIVDKSGIANVEDVERVYRETFILTTLKHQNIIKLFEVLDTPKSIMLVMEYAGGGELFSYVSSKHRLGELESCRLFQQIIAGVECKETIQTHATIDESVWHPF